MGEAGRREYSTRKVGEKGKRKKSKRERGRKRETGRKIPME